MMFLSLITKLKLHFISVKCSFASHNKCRISIYEHLGKEEKSMFSWL